MEEINRILNQTNNLKNKLSCNVCNNSSKIFSLPCDHKFCKSCVDDLNFGCSKCKQPFLVQDIKEDTFSNSVLEHLQLITEVLSSDSCDDSDYYSKTIDLPQELDGFKLVIKHEMKRNPKGETALHLACKRNNVENLLELIKNGVDINMKDYAGWSPLHEAVENTRIECVKCLLEAGALPSIPGESYITPLHKAAAMNNEEVIKLLLQYGANPLAVDYSGKSCIDWCVSLNSVSIMENQKQEYMITRPLFVDPLPEVFVDRKETQFPDSPFIQYENLDALKKGTITHYVFTQQDPQINLVNLVFAMVQGASVVSEQWVTYFLNDRKDYLGFGYVFKEREKGIKKSVINKLKNNPKLLDGINFFILPSNKPHKIMNTNFSRDDLTSLVTLGGGKMLKRQPALRTVENQFNYPYHSDATSKFAGCCNFIIYDENIQQQLMYNMKELKHKSSKWLIECILNFSVVS